MPKIATPKDLHAPLVYYILERTTLRIDCARVDYKSKGVIGTNRGRLQFADYIWTLTEAEILHHRTRLQEARQ